ncbi:MAG: alpha/beta fold hydrolase, partial [Verrucomicrobiaceae bacterium]
ERNFLKDFSMARNYYGVTAVAEFRGAHCGISFHDPVDDSKVRMGPHTYTLAADFTTSLAILLSKELPEKLGILRLLDPGKYADSARMIRLRPYNDDRIPLLLVHGLMDSPATWVPLINALRADPELRSRYQVWAYSYPSGYPYPYTAALLRRELDRAKIVFPNHKPIVAVGHSMGGIITRLMLTDSDDAVWDAYFHRSPDRVRMSAKQKSLMEEMLIFQSRDDIARAVFLNSPHRGAEMAGNWVGKLGRKLIRVPKLMISLGDAVRQVITLSEGGMAYEDLPTSIDSLTPNNLFVKTVVALPLNPRIPFHSIIGDRGKPKARANPELGSDGFVPYWSSHLEGARSEKIISSNHTGHQSPEGITEVLRILHLHLKTTR